MANQNTNSVSNNSRTTMDLPFYEQIKVIVPKIQIRSYHVPTRSDKCRFSSNFGIANEDIIKLGQRRRAHHELQLRIFFPEPDKNVVPRVRLGNQDVVYPKQNERAQQNPLCIDITSFCTNNGIGRTQDLKFEWDSTAEAVCEYTVLLVKSRSPDALIDQMRDNPNKNRPLELTKTTIIEQIKATKAGDFEINSVKIALIDPLAQKRIGIPARGSDCEHLRCFDLRNFLTINAKYPQATWKCPICEKHANFAKLIIDEYFENILQENKAETVEIQHDGTWHVEKANPNGNVENAAANLEENLEKQNKSNNEESEEQLEEKRKSAERILGKLNSLELPFYQEKKVLAPLMLFHSLPNMGFSACQFEIAGHLLGSYEVQLQMYLMEDSDILALEKFPLPTIHLGKSIVEYSPQHDVWIREYEPLVVNLTPLCKEQAQQTKQNLYLKWDGKKQAWAFSVVLVKRLYSMDLRLPKNMFFSFDDTKDMIIEQLTSNDDDIQISTMKISLVDSLTRKRIQIPSRGVYCEHVQCFDLYSYLSMNEKRPAWKCPICNEDAKFSTLCFDGYFQKVLEDTENTVEEVELLHDGTWRLSPRKTLLESGDEDVTMVMEKEGDGKARVICLSSDDENEENEGESSSNTASTSIASRRRKRALAHNNSVAQQVKEEPTEEPAEKRATL